MKNNYLTPAPILITNKASGLRMLKRNIFFKPAFLMCVFFIGITFSMSASGLYSEPSKEAPWKSKGLKEELLTKRTRNSKSFAKEGNQITSFISPASVHFKDATDNWKDISTEILSNSGANAQSHPYAALDNSIKTWFPSNPFTDYLLMSSNEGTYKERVKAIHFIDANNNVISSLPLTNNIVSAVSGNKIIYSGFNPHLTLEYSLNNDGRKFDLVIHSGAFLNAVPAGATAISIEEEFISENDFTRIETNDNTTLVFVNGKNVFKFNEPVAYDSNPLEDTRNSGSSSGKTKGKSTLLVTSFPVSWIGNNARQFPIHLDPTVSYYPQTASYWTGYGTTLSNKLDGILRISTSTTYAWAKFDLTNLPPGATVTQADYYGYHYTTTGSPTKVCEMRGLGALDPVTASGTAISGQAFSGTIYNTGFNWGGTTYGWQTGPLNSAGLSDVAAAAGGAISLGFRYLSGSTTFMYHYGWNASTSDICYLEVTYFTVPCTTAPGPNSVVSPTYAICPGTSANLNLSTTYSVGGITYQWQSSTVSAVGPFSAVPGATNPAMSTPTINVQTWYNVLMTCTSMPGSVVTATSGLVMVQATTTNSIPYHEGFENIQFENELPNCSWAANNLGNAAFTYTSAQTNGRVPNTGSNFASFYYSPAGSRYFYTNGLQLNAGVTYSASLWYTTEYYGYNNWTDLSIMFGPSQSATGMVTIASTNGPAISGVYKSLSNTFTVATSGIYYVAVKADVNTNSWAYYLSWDDLEITAPCSLNTPSVSLSTNATTICANSSVVLTATGADLYQWNTGSAAGTITHTLGNSTTFTVVGTSTLSMCSATLTQMIHVNPSPSIFIYASDWQVCPNDPVTLSVMNGQPLTSYVWSNNGNGISTIVHPTASTTYTVIGTNSFGCTGMATQAISVTPSPTVTAFSSQPGEMCFGEMQELTATGALNYTWVSGATNAVFLGNIITISPAATTIYSVTGTDANGCSGMTTLVQMVSECLGINENALKNLNVFPNPTSGTVTFELGGSDLKTLEVTDIAGKLISSTSSSEELVQLDLTNLASGVYYVKISSETSRSVVKVIKQ